MEQPTATTAGPTGVAGVVAEARARLGTLQETLWAARGDAELVATVAELEGLRSALAALEAAAVAELHARDVPKRRLGWGSTADWFSHLAGLTRREGHRTVRHAPALVAGRGATRAALAAGAISPEQAAVIVTAVDQLPADPRVRATGEAALLAEAGRLTATDLATTARRLAEIVDPDGTDRAAERALDREDRAAHHGRFLALTQDGAGGIRLRGRGTLEDAALIKAALLPLTKPTPATGHHGDPDGSDPGDPGCAEAKDPRDHGARLWDALVAACGHALATDLPPDSHGARPRLTITLSLDALRDQLAATRPAPTHPGGVTDDGLELSPATVRRLACDADLIPVALGGAGEVLDVGRTHRLVTPALWRALACRDRHCTFPGCTRPPVMGHAHHLTHWADGGSTSLDNLVLVCGHHHRTLHHTPWQARLNPTDGRPEYQPPPRPGHPPRWIRSRPRRE